MTGRNSKRLSGAVQELVERAVETGRYASADEVVREGLQLLEQRDSAELRLRELIAASLREGGQVSDEDLARDLDKLDLELAQDGL